MTREHSNKAARLRRRPFADLLRRASPWQGLNDDDKLRDLDLTFMYVNDVCYKRSRVQQGDQCK